MLEGRKEITESVISQFLEGNDPMERIVNLDYKYNEEKIKVIYRDENDKKKEMMDFFHPFCWATRAACDRLCNGDREALKALLRKYSIKVTKLDTRDTTGKFREEYDNGYLFLFQATRALSYKQFLKFFEEAENPIYSKSEDINGKSRSKQYLIVTPQEQYMIATGKRFFKGYEDYNELLRLIFDLETEGLDPTRHRILQLGIRFNRPVMTKTGLREYSQIFSLSGLTEEEKDEKERELIGVMMKMIQHYRPDVVSAHNGENFDWWFIIERCKVLGIEIEEFSKNFFNGESIRKNPKESILKLGGEIETFKQTIVPGTIVTDSLHAVRRAQALDSNMEQANLKYVTRYSKIVKANRVYVPGEQISTILKDLNVTYAFNDEDGDWYYYDSTLPDSTMEFQKGMGPKGFTMYRRNYIAEGYTLVSGKYIVERYLMDDLWECDMVEHRYNTTNFLICKMLPVPFQKCCTMGTAGQWKAIMLAWSYENNLAIPMFGESKSFTGGLSRLLKVGFVDNVAKFDYNSLYPSITLTWDISDPSKDLMGSMLMFLEYVLTQREKYKAGKKTASKNKKKIDEQLANFQGSQSEKEKMTAQLRSYASEEASFDKKQIQMKVLGNSYFGSYGAPNIFPFGSLMCAERITCTGRMCLRLMISHFNNLGYEPIVGDSFTGDTPLFIKYKEDFGSNKKGWIEIKPVEELIDEDKIEIDALNREYDYSEKPYWVLCRSGWHECGYVYRHATDKDVYRVSDDNGMILDVTEDHSLFNADKQKIKPSEINEDTKLEYYDGTIETGSEEAFWPTIELDISKVADGQLDRFPTYFLNFTPQYYRDIIDCWEEYRYPDREYSKTVLAQVMFMESKIVR